VGTTIVFCVVATAKFLHGAWLLAIAFPLFMYLFRRVRHHYDQVARQLTLEGFRPRTDRLTSLIVVPVASLHRGTVLAMIYARTLGSTLRAVHVIIDQSQWERLQKLWAQWEPDVPLIGLPSPYRSLTQPIVEYVASQRTQYDIVTVLIPEFVVAHWWEHLLHNQSAIALSFALRHLRGVSIIHFPYQLEA
jgi:hypothetical protein